MMMMMMMEKVIMMKTRHHLGDHWGFTQDMMSLLLGSLSKNDANNDMNEWLIFGSSFL